MFFAHWVTKYSKARGTRPASHTGRTARLTPAAGMDDPRLDPGKLLPYLSIPVLDGKFSPIVPPINKITILTIL